MKTSTKIVIAAVICVVLYTVAAFVLQFRGEMEISSTLTTCWFTFWSVEIASLAGIKITKTKCHYDESEDYGE